MFSVITLSQKKHDPFGRRILKISKPCTGGTPQANTTWTYTYYVNDAQGNVMATYDYQITSTLQRIFLSEQMLYGSSRLGLVTRDKRLATRVIATGVVTDEEMDDTTRLLGRKRYEYTNHLGNVLLVTTDRKMSIDTDTDDTTDHFHCVIDAYYDYGPFGNVLDGRKGGNGYRYGFQNQEKDDELYGDNNSVNFGNRMYDPRLGKFLSRDKYAIFYPGISPYTFACNIPTKATDFNGDYIRFVGSEYEVTKFDALIKQLRSSAEGERLFQAIVASDVEVNISFQKRDHTSSKDKNVIMMTLFSDEGFEEARGDKRSDVGDMARLFREAEKDIFSLKYSEPEENIKKSGSKYYSNKEKITENASNDAMYHCMDFDRWDAYYTENIVRDELKLVLRNYAFEDLNGYDPVYLPLVDQKVQWVGKGYKVPNGEENYAVIFSPTLLPIDSKAKGDVYSKVRSISDPVNNFSLNTKVNTLKDYGFFLTKEKIYTNGGPAGSLGKKAGDAGNNNSTGDKKGEVRSKY